MTQGPSPWDEARRQAERLEAIFASAEVVTEAELAAHGISPVTVVHGDPETSQDADLIHELHRLAGECGPLRGWRGGGDYVTFLFSGPAAGQDAAALIARAAAIARPWWRITATVRPAWHPGHPGA
jgi:hypothetical protein